MERFIARQPILDGSLKVYGYELLFRSDLANYFHEPDGDRASSRVIADSVLLFGMDTLTHGTKAFINFTKNLLLQDYAMLMPASHTVVEVLETVKPVPEILEACRRLKNKGFVLALDDFVHSPEYAPLSEMADIIKVDFLTEDEGQRRRIAEIFKPKGVRLLAEKVETQEDYRQAKQMGYSLFQGYFFSEPIMVTRRDLPANKLNYLRLLKEIHSPDMDYESLGRLVSSDTSLSYKLMRYINSAAFSLRHPVSSIKHAIAMLGEYQLRQWASLLAVSGLGEDKPAELMVTSVTRARLAELLAPELGMVDYASDLFLMGLFSLLDTLLGRPMEEILAELNLSAELKGALLGGESNLSPVLKLVLAYEQACWPDVSAVCSSLGLDEPKLPDLFLEAADFSANVFGDAA